jgi:hypothetical protein
MGIDWNAEVVDQRELDERRDAWIRDVRSLGATGLARPPGDISPPAFAEAPIARLVLYPHVEIIHHGAEVCLLRDLCRGKDDRAGG